MFHPRHSEYPKSKNYSQEEQAVERETWRHVDFDATVPRLCKLVERLKLSESTEEIFEDPSPRIIDHATIY